MKKINIHSKLNRITLLFVATVTLVFHNEVYAKTVEISDDIQRGVKGFYGLSLGSFFEMYPHECGAVLYSRKIFQCNLPKKHRIYPEFRVGWLYSQNVVESGSALNLIPFQANFFWDWEKLHFETRAGELSINPFLGAGVYFINFQSLVSNVSGGGVGYQVGLNFEYSHPGMKYFYIDIGIEHQMIFDFSTYLPNLVFNIGIGYNFGKKIAEGKTRVEKDQLQKYLDDLESNDEKLISSACIWLGNRGVILAMPRLIQLLKTDERYSVRNYAAVGLGLIGDRRGLTPLLEAALHDENSSVQYTCVISISRIGPTISVKKALRDAKNKFTDPMIVDYIEKME